MTEETAATPANVKMLDPKNWPASKIYTRKIASLNPYHNNSRRHSERQIDQIIASMGEWGWTIPILVDEENNIIAGHGRVMAAAKIGIDSVPVMIAKGWSEKQKRAYVIADNKLTLNSEWDEELLASELEELKMDDFEMDLIGFDESELSGILGETEPEAETRETEAPEVEDIAVTKFGEVWVCGEHVVMCGDSTKIEDVNTLTNFVPIDCVYTDPPYGISIVSGAGKVGGGGPAGGVKAQKKKGKVGGGKIVEARDYAPVIGDESIDAALAAIEIIKQLAPPVQIIWGGNYFSAHLENSPCWIVWDKQNTGNFADAELAWTNQSTAVRIFQHMWNGMIRASERGKPRVHPTQKPVALGVFCLKEYASKSKTVLDLFAGSGSALLACEDLGKRGFMMEMSPNYVDVIVKRWQDHTGREATLLGSDKTFAQISEERLETSSD